MARVKIEARMDFDRGPHPSEPTASEEGDLPYPSRETRVIPPRPGRVLPHRDPERLGALLERLEPRLRAVALRFTKDADTARDIVQSAFEKAIRHGAGFQGQSLVSTWMHRIVANEALMWLRSERRRAEVSSETGRGDEAAVADSAPGPAEDLDRRLRTARLREAIEQLCREEREVVLSCALAGLSYAEYGERTGTHPAAVKSRAFRARRRLGALLTEPRPPQPAAALTRTASGCHSPGKLRLIGGAPWGADASTTSSSRSRSASASASRATRYGSASTSSGGTRSSSRSKPPSPSARGR
jgi:RNA polymerase sigma-70 factor (ECF subfamily)